MCNQRRHRAGAASWFALRRRSAGQFTRERTFRVLIPFFTGTILLGPVQLYLSRLHRSQTGVFDGTLLDFVGVRLAYPFPKILGALGYHMCFLGFPFFYSLLALPLFIWLKGETGRRVISRLARLCERRGAILLFILPLVVVRLALQPFSPDCRTGPNSSLALSRTPAESTSPHPVLAVPLFDKDSILVIL